MKRHSGDLPSLSIEQMRAVDRAMMETYRITLLQMMENAGRSLAELARERFLGGKPAGKRVAVLAGAGGNGGGAMAAARRLAGWGARVSVSVTRPLGELRGATSRQAKSLEQMQVPVDAQGSPTEADLVIDGVIGYSLRGTPHGRAADLIRWANRQEAPVLALDVPSGMHAGNGEILEPAARAAATLTLALPKSGLGHEGARAYIGELYLADIGVPPDLYRRAEIGVEVGPIFAESDILRLR